MPRHSSDYHHQGSSRGLSIAVFCAMAIIALVLWSRRESGFNFLGGNNILVGCLLSAFAGAISLFGYLLSRNSGRVQSSGLWQLIEGLSALVPPAVITMCLLPISAEARPWVLFLFLIVGFFGLISLTNIELSDGRPHKFHQREYLFDRGLGQPFLATIDVANPETNLPRGRRRNNLRDEDETVERIGSGSRSRLRTGITGSHRAIDAAPQPVAPPQPTVDGKLKQQISRFVAHNGDDRVEAIWSVHFDREQKRTVVHVPFSPAFASRPQVECSVVDGDGVTLKVAEVHPYGVRIEARRSQTNQATDVTIGFHASAKPDSRTSNSGTLNSATSTSRTSDSQTSHTRTSNTRTSNTRMPDTRGPQAVGSEFATSVGRGADVVTDALASGGRAVGEVVGDTGRAVANTGRAVTDSVSQKASSLAEGASRLKRAVTGSDPVFSLGNPAEKVRQTAERISRTTGPHNPPGEFPDEPGSNSSSRTS